MSEDNAMKEDLLEWYDGMDANVAVVSADDKEKENADDKENDDDKESVEKKVDKIETSAELHKCMALVKALDNKLALLSGAFVGYDNKEKQDALKAEVKEVSKRISKIIAEI